MTKYLKGLALEGNETRDRIGWGIAISRRTDPTKQGKKQGNNDDDDNFIMNTVGRPRSISCDHHFIDDGEILTMATGDTI